MLNVIFGDVKEAIYNRSLYICTKKAFQYMLNERPQTLQGLRIVMAS